MRRALIQIAVAVAFTGCKEEPLVMPAEASEIAVASSSPVPAFDRARFDPAMKSFLEAALLQLETCDLACEEPRGQSDFRCFDVCKTDPSDIRPVIEKGQQAMSAFERSKAPETASLVVTRSNLYIKWLENVEKTRVSRGSMLHYQQLALAWNAYSPKEGVPTEPKRAIHQYTVEHPAPFVDYIWEHGLYKSHQRQGTPLPWNQGPQGPYIPADRE